MTPLDKISRARATLFVKAPFFATLALSMGAIEARAGLTETMATDGISLYYCGTFVDSICGEELRAVIAHECLHVALLHHTRRGNRDPRLWNVACDYAVNWILIQDGFRLPAGALIDSRFAGMTAEKIYSILAQESDSDSGDSGDSDSDSDSDSGDSGDSDSDSDSGGGGDSDSGGGGGVGGGKPGQFGDILDAAAPGDSAAMASAEMAARALVTQAATAAESAGHGSALSRAMRDKARETPRDIWAVLQRFVDRSARTIQSWQRPNRRHIASGLFLPGRVPDGMGRLAIVFDVSGSIDPVKKATFESALHNAIETAGPDLIDVIYCDSAIIGRDEFESGDSIVFRDITGGGTDMQPALDAVKETDAAACIVFTDCEFWRPLADPGVPVLWARWGNGNAPQFGELIDV